MERDVVIRQSAAAVFEALTNFGTGSRWYTGVTEVRLEPDGPVAQGTAITQFREETGRREVTRYLVAAVEPPRILTLQSVGAKPASTIHYSLAPDGAAVKLTCAITVETGGLVQLVNSRLRRDLDNKLGETLDTFRGVMEQS